LEEISSGLASSLISHADHANIFLIPSAKNPEKLNSFCTQIGAKNYGKLDTAKLETQKINTTDPFFQEVFAGSTQDAYWPTVNKHYKFVGNTTRPTFNLMTLVNGDPLFLRLSNKSVNIFQLAIPLDETFSNIVTHPVVVPLFIKALVKKDNISSFTGEIGIDSRFDIKTIDNTSETPISLTGYDVDFIPRQQKRGNITSIVAGADLQRAGNYKLQLNEKTLGTISFNTSKSESDLQRFSVGELKTIISNRNLDNVSILEANAATLKTVLIELQQGIQLWKYCLLIALIFVLLEVILLRFLK